MPGFANIAQPLFEAITEDRVDTDVVRTTYKRLVAANGKALASFRTGVTSELFVDASEYAIGAVLEQGGHPVTCVSRKLSTAEKNYSQTQKEALASDEVTQISLRQSIRHRHRSQGATINTSSIPVCRSARRHRQCYNDGR